MNLGILFENFFEFFMGHLFPYESDVSHHKVLDMNFVRSYRMYHSNNVDWLDWIRLKIRLTNSFTILRRKNIGQKGQFLDHDDRIVERRLQQSWNGVGNKDGNKNRNDVINLARHFRNDDANWNRVRDASRESSRTDDGVASYINWNIIAE